MNRKVVRRLTRLARLLMASLLLQAIVWHAPKAASAEEIGAGDLYQESFNGIAAGNKPAGSDWSFGEAYGSVSVAETPDSSDKSLRIERTDVDTASGLYARKSFATPLTGRFIVRTRVMAEQTNAAVVAMSLRSSDSKEFLAVTLTAQGQIRYQTATGSVVLQSYAEDVWYDIAAVVDTDTQQYGIVIDGQWKVGPIAFKDLDAENFKRIEYQVYKTTPGTAYFDELSVYSHEVDLSASSVTLPLGQSDALEADVTPGWPALEGVTWTTSDPSVVRVDSSGAITAYGYGTAAVRATSVGGAYAECIVTVPSGPNVPVTGLSLDGDALTIREGDVVPLEAYLQPFYASNKGIEWASSEPSVVSVVYDAGSSIATLTGLEPGESVITAVSEDGDYGDSLTVTVLRQPDLFDESFEGYAEGTKPTSLTVPTASGADATVTSKPYSSGKALRIEKTEATSSSYMVTRSVPTGNEKMKLSMKAMAKQKNAVAYVSAIRNRAGTAILYVAFHNTGKISVFHSGAWEAVQAYETNRWYQFDLAIDTTTGTYDLYIDGEPKRVGLPLMASGSEVATLQFGIYSLSTGTAYYDDIQGYSYEAVTGVSTSGLPSELSLGRTYRLRPELAPIEPTFESASWSSSDEAVVSIDELGNATAVGLGTATLTAVTTDGSFTDQAMVQVVEKLPESLVLTPSSLTLPVGSDRQLVPAMEPYDATNGNVTWASSDTGVATVDEEGRVFAVGAGTATITATTEEEEIAATSSLTVVNRSVQAELYVSPDGDDGNPGTLASPYRTLERARDAARTMNDEMTGDIVIYLRGGDYALDSTFYLDERDSGSNGYRIVYRAYEGEEPVVEGGKRITGWTLYDAENNIYKADAGFDIETRQLYVDGVRAVRARSDGGLTNPEIVSGGYRSDDIELAGWGNIGDMELVLKAEWTNPRNRIASITTDNGQAVITMQQPGWSYVTSKDSVDYPWYIENAYELIDRPGEWYLDRTTDTFYYKPRPGENMSTADVVAPVLEKLMHIEGTTLDTPVDGIRFEGLTFSYATWLRPSGDRGHADGQNNSLRDDNEKLPPGNIQVEKAAHIDFIGNDFSKLGIIGLEMINGVQQVQIVGNRFYDISGGAVDIGEVSKFDPDIYLPSDPRLVMRGFTIENNYVHDIGIDYRSSAAFGLGFLVDSSISHNELFNLPYDGITIGFGFDLIPTSVLRNVKIHANFIHDLMGDQIYDGGAIYTLGRTGGSLNDMNEITENYVRNQMNRYGTIYNDQGSTNWAIERNVIDQSESPVWDEIFPANWAFVNGGSYNILYDSNYTTVSNTRLYGDNVSTVNTYLYPDADWPTEALEIIDNSGLEEPYRAMAEDVPERIAVPAALNVSTGNSVALNVTAADGKDGTVDLDGADLFYYSDDESVAEVSVSGSVYGVGSGVATVHVGVKVGDMLWMKQVPVYVDDEFSRIDAYYGENKARYDLGGELELLKGAKKQLYVEAKSIFGQTLEPSSLSYTSSDENVATISAQGLLTAIDSGTADIEFELVVDGVPRTKLVEVTVFQIGDDAGLTYTPTSFEDAINDPTNWYVSATGSGNLQASADEIEISTPAGFATYTGETYEDELLEMDVRIDADGGWPSLALRVQESDEAFDSPTNDLYLLVFKTDVIELHRFNGGVRTVIYGSINGYTSIGGPAIPNDYLPFRETRRVQFGAVNESGGVRLILNIDGRNVFYFLDDEAERIEDSGYFGLYARSGSIMLKTPE
ncbi:Ig-like domain-containing protein [Cohnella fermenti]|uniref:Ig-like domain-containing protein n=1 Tax=Cohnella fermenti TaxID=2565925 RepID=UPI001454BC31|nr:Ig-like domain-containing protein [Cohnella fermenti]